MAVIIVLWGRQILSQKVVPSSMSKTMNRAPVLVLSLFSELGQIQAHEPSH